MSLKDTYRQSFIDVVEKNSEIGFVEEINHPIVSIKGLPRAICNEVVYFESGCIGMVTSLSNRNLQVLLFANESVKVGEKVARSGDVFRVPVGEGLLGQVITPLGTSMYQNKVIPGIEEYRATDSIPLPINLRERVQSPLETGISLVDMLIPLGKGQRELIIGDGNTGKTAFVLQSILRQAQLGTICIYAAIAKKKSSIKKAEQLFERHKIKDNTIIVGSGSSDPIASVYLTPYVAMTVAEYFRDKGRDVLLILDDLSTHAKYYREISLISRKFPGRDSYPGDVFFIHARLLERAGNFNINGKKSSITCLPVASSIEGDITGYIQTNLMSITDGHIFFDNAIFKEGRRPAINYFLSVTRVGRQTQNSIRWGINRELSSFLTLHNKTERFIHFGAEINEGIKSALEMGKKVYKFLEQGSEDVYSANIQVILFTLLWIGVLDDEKIQDYRTKAQVLYDKDNTFKNKIDELINSSGDFNNLLGKVSANYKDLINYIEEGSA